HRLAAGLDRGRAHGPSRATSAEASEPEEEVPMADAARVAAQAVPISTESSRRLFGEGLSQGCRMGRPEGRCVAAPRRPSKAVGRAGSLVQVNGSYRERKVGKSPRRSPGTRAAGARRTVRPPGGSLPL